MENSIQINRIFLSQFKLEEAKSKFMKSKILFRRLKRCLWRKCEPLADTMERGGGHRLTVEQGGCLVGGREGESERARGRER